MSQVDQSSAFRDIPVKHEHSAILPVDPSNFNAVVNDSIDSLPAIYGSDAMEASWRIESGGLQHSRSQISTVIRT
jgi:hypothetical protein